VTHPPGRPVRRGGGARPRWAVVATAVEDSDRSRLWQALMDRCPTYDDYQAKVSRRIALVRLFPA
jgi:hypothetical protein